MQLSDLIIFGRLGNIVAESKDKYLFKPNNNFQPIIFSETTELFLIFDNSTVRYSDFAYSKINEKFVLSFDDYFIKQDIKSANSTLLALAPEDYNSICQIDSSIVLTTKVVFQNEIIGEIVNVFDNGSYDTIIVKTPEKEVMIPLVEEYVKEIDSDFIELKNIDELLQL